MFDVGDDAEVTATFRVAGTLTDPGTVAADVYPPTSAMFTVTYPAAALTKTSTGVYKLVVDCTEAGRWRVVWRSTGTGKAAESYSFIVQRTPPN